MPSRIHYYCTNTYSFALGIFAAYWAKGMADSLRIVPYSYFPKLPEFAPGIHIFTDFDRMRGWENSAVDRVVDQLRAAGNRVLNQPSRVKMRFELLRALHAAGINDFNAYRIADWRQAKRFPVFIRHADGHRKPLTDLLDDPDALRSAAEPLIAAHGAGSDLIVVEFGNARDADGRFRKHSAFRVGEHHYASSLQANAHWWVKYSDSESAADKAAQAEYQKTNPYRDQLVPIWEIVGAEYGRMDFCVVDGRVQVFEVNTNPTIAFIPSEKTRDHDHYTVAHEEALNMLLESHEGGDSIPNPLHKPGMDRSSADEIHAMVLAEGRKVWPDSWRKTPSPTAEAPAKARQSAATD